MKAGTLLCSACLLSAGNATEPMEPVSAGVITLPYDFGGYRLHRKLGAGGMGVVYEAEERNTGRRLALKVLRQSLGTEEDHKRFRREGKLAAAVNHPNSLYVFGAEEIEGAPVIVTELADGGTLRDEVKRRGPLPVEEAVDAMIAVLDGLEAAHRHGVLHRDMKPSNCFVSNQGVTKVGDYGLSISHRDESPGEDPLTRTGIIMGTPAFSPPEQLRGQGLDQRADIYSTAATLYYLLTGKAPVEAGNSVATVAAVLEGRIRPPHELRPELPVNLSKVIMHALSADVAKRPASHAEFRLALLPFSSVAPAPAPLGLRFLAGVVDASILGILLALFWSIPAVAGLSEDRYDLLISLAAALTTVLFYTLFETRIGATPGKQLLGLRVLAAGGALPTWKPYLVRSILFFPCYLLADFLPNDYWFPESMTGAAEFVGWLLLALGVYFLHFVLFIPSLRRKNRAAWHDIASGLRVTQCRIGNPRIAVTNALPDLKPATASAVWGGLIAGEEVSAGLRWAHDPLLQRPVLLRRRPSSDEAPSEVRRFCARPGRLRWHHAVRDPDGASWDVWQAIPGQSLEAVVQKQPGPTWDIVLHWLHDLASELDASQKEGTLPTSLTSGHVWITTEGRALLLDERWPATPEPLFSASAPQAFLGQIASLAQPCTRPLSADPVITALQRGGFERLSHATGTFAHLQQLPSSIDRTRRAACLLAPVALLATFLLTGLCLEVEEWNKWSSAFPGQPPLPEVIRLHEFQTAQHGVDYPLKDAIRQHAAGHYAAYVRDNGLDSLPEDYRDLFLDDDIKSFVTERITNTDAKEESGTERADAKIRAALAEIPQRLLLSEFGKLAAFVLLCFVAVTAISQLTCILTLGAPLLMSLSGVAVISARSRPATRSRMIWRWCLGWGLASCLYLPTLIITILLRDAAVDTSFLPVLLILLVLVSALALVGRRSPVDRLAGTWLVPR